MTTRLALAFKNLGRNRRRNLATASAIILGCAGLIVLSGFVTRIEKFFRATSVYLNQVGSLSVYKREGLKRHLLKPDKYNLSPDEQKRTKQVIERLFPQHEGIGASLYGFTLLGNGCKTWPVRVTGLEAALEDKLLRHWAVKKYAAELLSTRRGKGLSEFKDMLPILVTEKVARNLGKSKLNFNATREPASRSASNIPDCSAPSFRVQSASDPNVHLAGQTFKNRFSAVDAEIVGMYSSGLELLEESAALLPLDALQRLYETDTVTKLSVFLPWDTPVEKNARDLAIALQREGLDLEVHHFKEFSINPFYAGFMNLIYVMSSFFLTLALCVVTLTVSDAMTMSVLERSKEMGTLRALGFKQKVISRMFSEEGALLGLLSVPVGLLVAWIVTLVINNAEILFEVPGVATQLKIVLEIDTLHCAVVFLMVICVSSISGWISSVRASQRKIVNLLQSHVS